MKDLVKWLDKNTNIILIIIIIIGISMMNQPTDDKKEVKIPGFGTGWTGTVTLGAGALLLSRLGGFFGALGPVGWIAMGIGALVMVGPSIIGSWQDLFRPDPTIPGWIWIAAFVVIMFVVITRKK